jgi:hypothetical protein
MGRFTLLSLDFAQLLSSLVERFVDNFDERTDYGESTVKGIITITQNPQKRDRAGDLLRFGSGSTAYVAVSAGRPLRGAPPS